jgi:hypothetical protein
MLYTLYGYFLRLVSNIAVQAGPTNLNSIDPVYTVSLNILNLVSRLRLRLVTLQCTF